MTPTPFRWRQDTLSSDGWLVAGRALALPEDAATAGELWSAASQVQERTGVGLFPVAYEDGSNPDLAVGGRWLLVGVRIAGALEGDPKEVGLDGIRAALDGVRGTDWDLVKSLLPAGWREALDGAELGVFCIAWGCSRQAAAQLMFGVVAPCVEPPEEDEALDRYLDEQGFVPPTPPRLGATARFRVNCDVDYRAETGVWGISVGYYDNDERVLEGIRFDDEAQRGREAELGGGFEGRYYLLSSGTLFSS